jgi:Family of unknown function (DUF6516)
MIVNMNARLVRNRKLTLPDGAIVETVIWELPHPVPGSSHLFKYRLYFGRKGKRIVGFDNERGKGDHCHLDGLEMPYVFSTVDKLLDDFFDEIERRQKP